MRTTTLELEEERMRNAEGQAPERHSTRETNNPDHEEIAREAYECWMERGCPEGSPQEDWYRAERKLRGRMA